MEVFLRWVLCNAIITVNPAIFKAAAHLLCTLTDTEKQNEIIHTFFGIESLADLKRSAGRSGYRIRLPEYIHDKKYRDKRRNTLNPKVVDCFFETRHYFMLKTRDDSEEISAYEAKQGKAPKGIIAKQIYSLVKENLKTDTVAEPVRSAVYGLFNAIKLCRHKAPVAVSSQNHWKAMVLSVGQNLLRKTRLTDLIWRNTNWFNALDFLPNRMPENFTAEFLQDFSINLMDGTHKKQSYLLRLGRYGDMIKVQIKKGKVTFLLASGLARGVLAMDKPLSPSAAYQQLNQLRQKIRQHNRSIAAARKISKKADPASTQASAQPPSANKARQNTTTAGTLSQATILQQHQNSDQQPESKPCSRVALS